MRPQLHTYRHIASGKVRDIYEIDKDHLLFVASDRISAFDVVLDTPIPDKGRVLTAMSVHFFHVLGYSNHLAGDEEDLRIPAEVLGRALVVRKLHMVPVECVARGYLTGSGLVDYQRTGQVGGNVLPPGLEEASRLRNPIFTPATKADLGEHDENITFEQLIDRMGRDVALRLREDTLDIYVRAQKYVIERGIILADTKLEFGMDAQGNLILADEVLTPDSSRYWPSEAYIPGKTQPSFDKQFVRDWLMSSASGWDRTSNQLPPSLPEDIVAATRARYIEAYEQISGLRFDDWIQ